MENIPSKTKKIVRDNLLMAKLFLFALRALNRSGELFSPLIFQISPDTWDTHKSLSLHEA
jgi:hypothetical protein